MVSGLTDVASKQATMKERRSELVAMDKEIERVLQAWAPEEAAPSTGCFSKLRICHTWISKGRSRVATIEPAVGAAAVGVVGATTGLRQSGENNGLLNRLVGVRKQYGADTDKIESAIHTVQLRVEALEDRMKIGRERALMARQAGKQEQAVREMRKAKAVEKQLVVTRVALDTLERQQDLIAETTLQRELATTLKSTTASVKTKSKGLLSLAETAIDESIEVRDDAEDVSAVFEGMAPAYDTSVDDADLLAELDELVGTKPELTATVVPTHAIGVELFPSAPQEAPVRCNEKKALLSDDSSLAGVM